MPVALEKDKVIERELKAGEFLVVAVHQRGIDVVVCVFAPDNSKTARIDSPNEDYADEPIALEAKSDGNYRIGISSLDKNAPTGRYEIKINGLVPADVYAKRVSEAARISEASRAGTPRLNRSLFRWQ